MKTRRIEPGTYLTLDGRWVIERTHDGREWRLFEVTGTGPHLAFDGDRALHCEWCETFPTKRMALEYLG